MVKMENKYISETKIADDVSRLFNKWMNDFVKNRDKDKGNFYLHINYARQQGEIDPSIQKYIADELHPSLKRITSTELSEAIIGGFDTTITDLGTPGSDRRKTWGKGNPRHKIKYKIPDNTEGVFENGKKSITIDELWGSGLKSELRYGKDLKEWIVDQLTVEIGYDKRMGSQRKLHTGEHLEGEIIVPDKNISTQIRKTKKIINIMNNKGDLKVYDLYKPNPVDGVGKICSHTSVRYPSALSKHFLTHNTASRPENGILVSINDDKEIEKDLRKIRDFAKDDFDERKRKEILVPDLDECFKKQLKNPKLKPRFNDLNTSKSMDQEQKWVISIPDDELPMYNGKSYGIKTIKEIYKQMSKFGIAGRTSSTEYYYAGNDPEIERRFNEYLEGKIVKVRLRDNFNDLTPEYKNALNHARKSFEYVNHYLYNPFFGKMTTKIEALNPYNKSKGVRRNSTEKYYRPWIEKFENTVSTLEKYGVMNPDFILPTENIGLSIDDRYKMNDEFMQRNIAPKFDYENINKEISKNEILVDDLDYLNKITQIQLISESINLLTDDFNEISNSFMAFFKSYKGKPYNLNGNDLKAVLAYYRQLFGGIIIGNDVSIPPGRSYRNISDLDKQNHEEFWNPVINTAKDLDRFNHDLDLFKNYHSKISNSKLTSKNIELNGYSHKIHSDIMNRFSQLLPNINKSIENLGYLFDYMDSKNHRSESYIILKDVFRNITNLIENVSKTLRKTLRK